MADSIWMPFEVVSGLGQGMGVLDGVEIIEGKGHTHTHNRFTAGLEYVRVHPGQQVPER